MHKMKVIFLVGYMLLTVFSSFALATGSSRWRMLADGSIEWVPAKQIPHSDHIEMVSIRPRACFFPLFSFLPLWLHYNLNPLCVQY